MKVPVPEPQISTDKQALSFDIDWRGESVTCVVTRGCLEVFFSGSRTTRTIAD
ncbi:DUF1488 family protein [Caballeronia sp. LZ029]|nr:DUF1488 family protein [Caballeronia sp. PC1]MCE4575249.1 DUF1488 family protein [Caballeronia sp. CLC5]MDR5748986.1 DUF1488 family protein [Caballeronia sp. LZ029]